ncbi:hypothetical protein BDQ17DRAFT_1429770 [Cyathus striatus]|nr:hypothetical protein BDQ17DRAFT_1429770 [Cyathus striatus]
MDASTALYASVSEQQFATRKYIVFATMFILVWEIMINFLKEYKYIWSTPTSFIKRAYICLRYIPLLALLLHSFLGPLSTPPVKESYCRMMFGIQAIFAQTCLMLFDIILLLRIYALYNKNRSIAYLVGIIFAADSTRAAARAVQFTHRLRFDARCAARDLNSPISITASILYITTHGIIWGLTWRKRNLGNQPGIPSIQAATRDGTWAYAGTSGARYFSCANVSLSKTPNKVMVAFVLSYTLKVSVSAETIVLCPIVIYSVVGCRIVLNLQKIADSTSVIEDMELLEVAND